MEETSRRAVIAAAAAVELAARATDAPAPAPATATMDEDEVGGPACLICMCDLADLDRTVLPRCSHSLFCLPCIVRWSSLHARCPLCAAPIGEYVLHAISSPTSYARHHLDLPPCEQPTAASSSRAVTSSTPLPRRSARPPVRPRPGEAVTQWGQPASRVETAWEDEVARRREVYVEGVYALHMASNATTRFKPAPTPQELSSTPHLQSHLRAWLMRELHALPCSSLDLSFLLTYALAILRTVHVRSEEAVALLAEFLGRDTAQHLLGETYAFLRSGRSVRAYDAVVRYDWSRSRAEVARKRRRDEAQELVDRSEAPGVTRRRGTSSRERNARRPSDEARIPTSPRASSNSASPATASTSTALIAATDVVSRSAPRAEVASLRARLLERLEAERASATATLVSTPVSATATAAVNKRDVLLQRLAAERAAAVSSSVTEASSGSSKMDDQSRRATLLLRLERERAQQQKQELHLEPIPVDDRGTVESRGQGDGR